MGVAHRHQTHLFFGSTGGTAYGIDTVTRAIAAAHQAGARGGTVACRRIGIGKHHAFLSQRIDVGRFKVLTSGKAAVLITQVVGKDQDDVWLLLGTKQSRAANSQQ